MLRSQSISNLNNTKSSSSFLKSLRSKKSDTDIKNGSTKSKRNSRPLSASISSFNLNISLPKLSSQKSFTEDNKENQNVVKTLRPRSSAPILTDHQSKNASSQTLSRPPISSKRYSSYYSTSSQISPQTVQSQIDSIFDESSVLCVDLENEENLSSSNSSLSSIVNQDHTYLQNKIHRSINSYNLSDFVNRMNGHSNNSENVEKNNLYELDQLAQWNAELTEIDNDNNTIGQFETKFKLIESILVVSVAHKNSLASVSTTKNILAIDDYSNVFKSEDYVEEDLMFSL